MSTEFQHGFLCGAVCCVNAVNCISHACGVCFGCFCLPCIITYYRFKKRVTGPSITIRNGGGISIPDIETMQ